MPIDPVAALRRDLGGKLCSGAEYLREWERRDSLVREEPSRAGCGLDRLAAGLRRGAFTEVRVPGPSQGGGLFLAALLARARSEGSYTALLDVGAGFEVEGFPERDLETLLWIGCASVMEAVALFDVVARDGNFRRIVLDGRDCPREDWRAVRAALWQRLARQIRERGAMGVLLTRVSTGMARDRYELEARLELGQLQGEREGIMEAVRVRRAEASGTWQLPDGLGASLGTSLGARKGERRWEAGKIA